MNKTTCPICKEDVFTSEMIVRDAVLYCKDCLLPERQYHVGDKVYYIKQPYVTLTVTDETTVHNKCAPHHRITAYSESGLYMAEGNETFFLKAKG